MHLPNLRCLQACKSVNWDNFLVQDRRPQVERRIKKIKMEALVAGKQALRHTPHHCVFGNMTHFSRRFAKKARGWRRGRRQNCVGVEGVWMSCLSKQALFFPPLLPVWSLFCNSSVSPALVSRRLTLLVEPGSRWRLAQKKKGHLPNGLMSSVIVLQARNHYFDKHFWKIDSQGLITRYCVTACVHKEMTSHISPPAHILLCNWR